MVIDTDYQLQPTEAEALAARLSVWTGRAHAVLASGRRKLSLVDCVSFEVLRQRGVRRVFAFDRHFKEQGLELVP